MTILVTGCLGQLGREIQKQLETAELKGPAGRARAAGCLRVVGVDLGDLDIGDLDQTLAFCRSIKPDAILNCAAFTAVDLCETEPDGAFRANALGPRNLAIAAAETGAKLVHVSTDYVFDGRGCPVKATERIGDGMDYMAPTQALSDTLRPYREFDAPNPLTVYGQSKLAGETFVREFCSRWFILRTAWLYGDGNNFAKTMLKLAETRDEVKVVADQHGTPTSARALAAAMLEVMATDAYGLYHATCEGMTDWHAFAKEVFRLKGLPTRVVPITTAEFPKPTPRPHWSVLDNGMLRMQGFTPFPHWQEELERYLRTVPAQV